MTVRVNRFLVRKKKTKSVIDPQGFYLRLHNALVASMRLAGNTAEADALVAILGTDLQALRERVAKDRDKK